MRSARLKLPPALFPVAYYHCISRVVDRRFIFKNDEKKRFIDWMRRYERFCGLRVVTFCLMSNHFHILLEVPRRPDEKDLPSDAQLVKLVREVQSEKTADALEQSLAEALQQAQQTALAEGVELSQVTEDASYAAAYWLRKHRAIRERWFARMWDVSTYMQSLKKRFTAWYNPLHNRKGTLWEERFKSVIVQGGMALATVGAYIDLNPVRAGVVKDAAEYKWSGYGEACSGVKEAQRNLQIIAQWMQVPFAADAQKVLEWYAQRLAQGTGNKAQSAGRKGRREQKGEPLVVGDASPEPTKTPKTDTPLPAPSLMQQVLYFSNGLIVGAEDFLEQVFQMKRDFFSPNRKDAARKMKGDDWGDLRVARDLRGS